MKTFLSLGFLVASIALVKSDATTEAPSTHDGSTVSGATLKPDDVRTKIKEQVLALTESCKTSSKITAEQAKIASNEAVPKTEGEKCFLECIYQGLNITKEGKFNEAGARGLAQLRFASSSEDLTKANSMIDACIKEIVVKDASEKCVLGRLIRECFVKHGSKLNFFPKP